MTTKERMKCQEKGISTITQLSYGYRPRRRRRIKPAALQGSQPVKHDHRLKALAIKNARIHVVGSPLLSIEGTPVFMDVEGMPDRGFYYLIGLRHETQGMHIEQSFWADAQEEEQDIWLKCLRALKQIDNPRIVHYGAYESRFLKHMRERWKPSPEDAQFVDCIVDGSVNLLSRMYGRVYFPTYSNGLKEIARWLGFEWTSAQASGGVALLLRRCWELTSDEEMRRKLITYNIEDCRAAEVVAEALVRICGHRVTPEEFRRATEVTYLGQVYGTMTALSRMRRRDRGTIVNRRSPIGRSRYSRLIAVRNAVRRLYRCRPYGADP